ncbi:MAG: hypothetical protein ACJ797_05625 [Ktedonobacteraceae bacterium]
MLVPQLPTSVPDQEANTTSVLLTIDGTGAWASRRTCLPTWLPPAVQELAVCAAPPCGTLLMCRLDQEHTPEPLRPLSAHVDAACSTDQVGDPGSHIPLSGDVRPAVHSGPPHTTRRTHERCDGAVPPARHAGARLPIARAGSSSEDQVQLEGCRAETEASDRQGQR